MSGVQEGLVLPEDEEEKEKTEADKEKFGGLCKVCFAGIEGHLHHSQHWYGLLLVIYFYLFALLHVCCLVQIELQSILCLQLIT